MRQGAHARRAKVSPPQGGKNTFRKGAPVKNGGKDFFVMKIRDGFVLRQVADATIVVPAGDAAIDFNGMITLNETAAFLWSLLEKETDEEEMVRAMLEEYEVEEETARAGIERFVEKLRAEGLLA